MAVLRHIWPVESSEHSFHDVFRLSEIALIVQGGTNAQQYCAARRNRNFYV